MATEKHTVLIHFDPERWEEAAELAAANYPVCYGDRGHWPFPGLWTILYHDWRRTLSGFIYRYFLPGKI